MADATVTIDTKLDESGLRDALSGLGSAVESALSGVMQALGNIGKEVFNVGSDFEKAMSDVGAITGGTASEMAQLESAAREMGRETVYSARDAAEAFKYFAIAGDDPEKMLESLSGISNLAAASVSEIGRTAEITADTMSAFGMKANEADHFADVLTMTMSMANVELNQLGESFKYAAPIAGQLGLSIEDTSVALGLMANAGIKGSQAGTSLQRVLQNLNTPTDKQREAQEKYGISLTDNEGKVKPLVEVFDDLRTNLGHLDPASRQAALAAMFHSTALTGLSAIVSATDDDFNDMVDSIYSTNDAWGSMGIAAETAARQTDNVQGVISKLSGTFDDMAISVFNAIKGPLKDGLNTFRDAMNEIADSMREGALQESLVRIGEAFEIFIEAGAKIASAVMPGLVSGFATFVEVMASFAAGIAVIIDWIVSFVSKVELLSALFDGAIAGVTAFVLTLATLTTGAGLALKAIQLMNGVLTAMQYPWIQAIALAVAFAAAATAMAEKILAFNDAQQEAHKRTMDLVASTDELIKSTQDSAKSFEDRKKAITDNIGETTKLLAKIEDLAAKENKSIGDRMELIALIDEFNGRMGETVLAYDMEADAILGSTDAIRARIDAIEEEARAQVMRERMIELIREEMALTEKQNEIDAERAKLQQDLIDGMYNQADALGGIGETHVGYLERLFQIEQKERELGIAQSENAENLQNLKDSWVEAQQAVNEFELSENIADMEAYKIALEASIEGLNDLIAATEKNIQAAQESGESTEALEKLLKQLKDALKDNETGYDDITKKIEDYKAAQDEASTTTENAGDAANDAAPPVKDLGDTFDDAGKKAEGSDRPINQLSDAVKNVGDEAETAGDKTKAGTDKMAEGYKEAGDAAEKGGEQIETANQTIISSSEKMADGVETETENAGDSYEQMGEKIQETGEQISDNIETTGEGIIAAVTATVEEAEDTIETGMDEINTNVETGLDTLVTTFETKLSELPPMVETKVGEAATAAKNKESDFIASGEALGNGLAKGMENTLSRVQAAAEKLATAAQAAVDAKLAISSPSKVAIEQGGYYGEGLAIGIENETPRVEKAVSTVTDIMTGIRKTVDEIIKGNDGLSASMRTGADAIQSNGFALYQQAGHLDEVANSLARLTTFQQLTNEQQQEARELVNELNTALGEEVAWYNEATQEITWYGEAIDTHILQMREMSELRSEEAQHLLDLETRLIELTSIQDISNEQQQEAIAIGYEINEILKESIVDFGAEGDMITWSSDAIRERIELLEQEAQAMEPRERMNQIIEEQARVEAALMEVQQRRAQLQQMLNDGVFEGGELNYEYASAMNELDTMERALLKTQGDLSGAYDDASKALDGSSKATDSAGQASDKFGTSQDKLASSTSTAASQVTDSWSNMGTGVETSANKLSTAVDSSMDKVTSSMKDKTTEAVDGARAIWEDSNTTDMGKIGIEKITDGIDEKAPGLKDAAEKAVRDAGDAANNIAENEFERIGRAMGQGIITGLNAMEGEIIARASAIATAAANAASAAVQEGSPSKVFMRIGKSMGQGLIVGMDNEVPRVASSYSAMLGDISSASRLSAASMADMGSFGGVTSNTIDRGVAVTLINNAPINNDMDLQMLARRLGQLIKEESRSYGNY